MLLCCRAPPRQSLCELEVDTCVEHILNRQEVRVALVLFWHHYSITRSRYTQACCTGFLHKVVTVSTRFMGCIHRNRCIALLVQMSPRDLYLYAMHCL
jgi:hypothetical protein